MSNQKREREEEEGEDIAEEKHAKPDKVLLCACCVDDVESALTGGDLFGATEEDGRTGLCLGCGRLDWDVALPIVKLLLPKPPASSMADQDGWKAGWNALHFAALASSAEVVSFLLRKMQSLINVRTIDSRDASALPLCCIRCDEKAVKVARVAGCRRRF
jgi:hypothetical protein